MGIEYEDENGKGEVTQCCRGGGILLRIYVFEIDIIFLVTASTEKPPGVALKLSTWEIQLPLFLHCCYYK